MVYVPLWWSMAYCSILWFICFFQIIFKPAILSTDLGPTTTDIKIKFWSKSNYIRWSNVKTIKIIVDFFTSTAYHRKSMNIIWKIALKIWKWIMNLISMNKIGLLLWIFVVAYGSHVRKISTDQFDLAHHQLWQSPKYCFY